MRHAYQNARALVLGSSGFIGRWVARSLTASGAELHLTVRDAERAAAVFPVFGISGTLHTIDLDNEIAVRDLIRTVRPMVTFNLAGYGIDRLERDGDTAFRINARLVEIVGEALTDAADRGWSGCHLIHVGSALEYGAVQRRSGGGDPSPAHDDCMDEPSSKGPERLATGCAGRGSLRGVQRPGCSRSTGRASMKGVSCPPCSRPRSGSRSRCSSPRADRMRDFCYVGDVAEGSATTRPVGRLKPGEVVNLARGELTTVSDGSPRLPPACWPSIPSRLQFGAIPSRDEEMQHDPVSVARLR